MEKTLGQLSDMQVYMIMREIQTMDEDGNWNANQEIEEEYFDLLGIIQEDLIKRGYKNQEAIEEKFGYIYDDEHRSYH